MLLGQSSIMLSVYSTKTDELLILQFVVLQSKTLSSVNSYGEMGFYFLEEQITYVLWYLESCGFGS